MQTVSIKEIPKNNFEYSFWAFEMVSLSEWVEAIFQWKSKKKSLIGKLDSIKFDILYKSWLKYRMCTCTL